MRCCDARVSLFTRTCVCHAFAMRYTLRFEAGLCSCPDSAIVQGAIFLGGNCPKGAVDWVAIILVGNCPRWELSGGQLSGGSCLGGSCPGGN